MIQLMAMSTRGAVAVLVAALAVAGGAGCHMQNGALEATASDQWTRSYDLSAGGDVQIVGGNGTVSVERGAGAKVEVTAERIARAAAESTAKDVLPRIKIREDITADRIVLQTEGLGGIVFGVNVTVNYKVVVPAGTKVRVRNANGAVTLSNLDAQATVSTENGAITGKGLGRGVEFRTTNGNVTADVANFDRDTVELRTVNGNIELTVPKDINANVIANVTNGGVDVSELAWEPSGEQTRRRVRGRLNAGGAPVDVTTVNGRVRIHSR